MIPFLKQKPFWIIFSLISIVLIIFAVVLLTPTSSPATPVINWTPEFITETISPGGSKVINVSFTSSEDLSNVNVWVVPELQPFVQINPTAFSQIIKGQAINLVLTLSASQDAPLGTFDGTVHLRVGSKTIAKPLPIGIIIKKIDPEMIISELVTTLRRGDIEESINNFTPRDKTLKALPTLNASQLNQLAYWLENAKLVEATENYRIYRYEWNENNEKNWVTFVMIKNSAGEWKLDTW